MILINTMVQPLYYCLFLPVTVLAALCTDTNLPFKFVCIGNSVEVFQNVISTISKSEYIFYKTFESKPETIAKWVMQNFSINATINPKYSQKVSLENGTILLHNFLVSDEATYSMMIHQNSFKTEKVKLCALDPPTLHCKPNITQVENYLHASLDNPEDCGTPSVYIRWMEYPGISNTSKSKIELPPGNEAGTYRACIEGETLNCVKNSSLRDNCENFTIGSRRENTDIPQLKTNTYMIVAIVVPLVIVVVLVIIIIILWKRRENVPCVNRGRTTGAPSTRTPDVAVADAEAGQANPETEPLAQSEDFEMHQMSSDAEAEQPLAQDGDIALQSMPSVHHQLETSV